MTIPLTHPIGTPPPRVAAQGPMDANPDSLRAIADHLSELNSHIARLSQAHDRVISALRSEPPPGVSRLDWIARMLNEET